MFSAMGLRENEEEKERKIHGQEGRKMEEVGIFVSSWKKMKFREKEEHISLKVAP